MKNIVAGHSPIINIVIPMAGEGSRFKQAGYVRPKPFIDVAGKSMIYRVINNLQFAGARFILIVRKECLQSEGAVFHELSATFDNVSWIEVERLTEGTVCSVLFAADEIDNEIPLVIANSDQLVEVPVEHFVVDAMMREIEGSIMTFPSQDTKWSYVKVDAGGQALEVREKEVISNQAATGIFYFRCGRLFVKSAIDMIIRNERVNDEFYVSPLFNRLIERKLRVGVYQIAKDEMHALGTPEDLVQYLRIVEYQCRT